MIPAPEKATFNRPAPWLQNCWYQAAWSHELAAAPLLTRRILDRDVLLFRDTSVAARAIEDRCPHRFAPLSAGTNAKASFERLRGVVAAMPGATIVVDQPDYLYAEFQSRIWHFVDDVEFLLDEPAGVIEVRSASRLGRKDFGVNRARIESIRAALIR